VPSTKLLSWDTFLNPYFLEPPSAYLSEHGSVAFDAALSLRASFCEEKPGRLTDQNVYLRALLELGLGRNSLFFRFDNLTQTFLQDVEDVSISGVSLQAIESVIRDFVSCGSNMKKLRSFVHDTTISSKASPALFSLASAISVVIFSLEAQLEMSMPSSPTLLQLSTLFQRSGEITKCLVDLVAATKLTETDEELMSIIFKKCERLIWQHEWLTKLLNEVVLRVSDPWLSFVEEWIGLRSSRGLPFGIGNTEISFVKTTSRDIVNESGTQATEVEYEMIDGRMPTFISPEHARSIFESGKNLRLLSDLQSEHPVVTSARNHSYPVPSLRWASSWVDLEAIQVKADQYEQSLRSAILDYNRNGQTSSKPLESSFDDSADTSELSCWIDETPELCPIDTLQDSGKPLASSSSTTSDPIYALLSTTSWHQTHIPTTTKTPFAPPFSLSPTLSLHPTLTAQSRLIDFCCLHLLFSTYNLPLHLTLQRRYHLFGDGVFTSHLSQSLFDPEMSSADRRSGIAQSGSHTGLRLGNRSTWPPAHSELRLVLMGLLHDTYFPSLSPTTDRGPNEQELPGNLSFAVRDLSEPEMEKCKNPNNIEALDFLRLQYKPPRALATIIAPLTLYKYDRLFKHLLRILRMLAVVRSLIRDVTDRSTRSQFTRNISQKFRVDAHHFVSSLVDYSLTTGIDSAWLPFEGKIAAVAKAIEKGDIDGTIAHAKSMSHLQSLHEDTLNRIISSLFLTKSQKQVRQLLEDIFNTVLAFVPLSRQAASGKDVHKELDKQIGELYQEFRKHVSSFLKFLRGAEDGSRGGKAWGNEHTQQGQGLDRLLLRLEMSDYYSR
jgi:hypothetical protein